ncbi:unnamed protein product [Adineta steineri]|uniref:Uncharacterized protein n=1 Tax=Adineta steineri TaxID=433720 RepID=A0A818RGE2_9BILA|nr:unnamed protein product [Adineta steineri]CAF3652632.1 unnamed protein product [Adineta steineri]
MNILITFLTVVILLISRIYSQSTTADSQYKTTEEITTVTTISTTTTTTTTLAPEVDHEWEDLILAGPTVVNYLGLFMVLASRKNQTLNASAEFTPKHLSVTQPLPAILSRISTDMQAAFKVANDDLIRTRSNMDQIPDHINAGLLLIQTAPNDLLKTLLPYTLKNVKRTANEGAAVTKPTLERFITVEAILEELVTLLISTSATKEDDINYLMEAKAYANDIQMQWSLLVKLFKKFSQRADITEIRIVDSFIKPTEVANNLTTPNQRHTHLDKLIPAAIAIDQSSHLLDIMALTYAEISNEHMINQIASNKPYLALATESARALDQRELWQNTIAQSVKVARLAQVRQNEFAATSSGRNERYSTYSKDPVAT